MKSRPFIFIILVSFIIISTGAKINNGFYFKTPKGYSFILPGQLLSNGQTIAMQAYFMSTYEITNGQYNEFLADLKKQTDTANYSVAKVKADNWKSFMVFNGSEYAGWADYPVVNISKEGAKLYCNWLGKKLNNEYQNKYTIEVRLPTKNEWEWAAYGKLKNTDYPWDGPYLRNSKGCYLAHFKLISQPLGPCKVGLYTPNANYLYDMAGNVAEMIGNGDIVKGGSWNSLADELRITKDMPYSVSPTVGFRPVITYITKK
jgi:hypothetical protein